MFLTKILIETNLQAFNQWHCLDMLLGWPWIDEKLQNLWTPQMLSLQDLNAFSLKKGCYPGQEIVARTHFLGKSKRNLRLLSGFGLLNGQILQQNSHEIGRIVNANALGNLAVAVLPLELNTDLAIQNNDNEVTLL
jgi:folate-binding protein YgfZ